MTIEDRMRWEPRHVHPRTTGASSAVQAVEAPSRGAVALDVACGQGRNSGAMLEAGYRVVALDISLNALRHLRSRFAGHGGSLLCVQADVDHWPLRPAAFDTVVVSDFFDRRLCATLAAALKPGGEILIDTFLDCGHPNAEGPSRADYLPARGELCRAFADLDVVDCTERDADTARVIFLARKPVPTR